MLLKIFTAIFGRVPFISSRARANAAGFSYRNESIPLQSIPEELHGVQLLSLTDPHIGGNIDSLAAEIHRNTKKLLEHSDPEKTLVLHGGDFICGQWTDLAKSERNAFDVADILFDGLGKYRNFAVVGNHDDEDVTFPEMREHLEKNIHAQFMIDPTDMKQVEINGKNIGIHGIHTLALRLHLMPHEERNALMDAYIDKLNNSGNDMNIVLLHCPDGLEFLLARLKETGKKFQTPTLFFSGHTHGGMFDMFMLRTIGLIVCKTKFGRYK